MLLIEALNLFVTVVMVVPSQEAIFQDLEEAEKNEEAAANRKASALICRLLNTGIKLQEKQYVSLLLFK